MKNFLKITLVIGLLTSLGSCVGWGSYGMGLPGGGTVVVSTGGYAGYGRYGGGYYSRPYYGHPHYGVYGGGYGRGGGYRGFRR